MMQFLHDRATSLFSKILLGFIVISFVGWGIADMFNNFRESATLIKIGNRKIHETELRGEIDHGMAQMRQLQQMLGSNQEMPFEAMISTTLSGLVEREIRFQFAQKNHLQIHPDSLKEAVRKLPAFQNEKGEFDAVKYDKMANQSPMQEKQLLEMTENNLLKSQFDSIQDFNVKTPKVLAERITEYAKERRHIQMVFVPQSWQAPQDIDAAELQKFYEQNAKSFEKPQSRNMSMMVFSPKDAPKPKALTPELVQQYFDSHKDVYAAPEERLVKQVVVSDEASAKAVYDQLVAGSSLEDIASTNKLQIKNPGWVKAGGLNKSIANAVFSSQVGAVKPVQTDIGWVVSVVEKIHEKTYPPLNTIEKFVRADAEKFYAADAFRVMGDEIEKGMIDGLPLKEVAAKQNLTYKSYENLQPSLGEEGLWSLPKNLRDVRELVKALSTMTEGEVSPLIDLGGQNYAYISIDKITPAATPALDQIKPEVEKAYRQKIGNEKTFVAVQDQVESLRHAGSLSDFAQKNNFHSQDFPSLSRVSKADVESLGSQHLENIFEMKEGEFMIEPVAANDPLAKNYGAGYFIVRLDKITKADQLNADEDKRLQGFLGKQLKDDALTNFSAALRKQIPIKVYEKPLNSFMEKLQHEDNS